MDVAVGIEECLAAVVPDDLHELEVRARLGRHVVGQQDRCRQHGLDTGSDSHLVVDRDRHGRNGDAHVERLELVRPCDADT